MDAQDFMPGGEIIDRIKADLAGHEADRDRVRRSVYWRVPLYLGLTFLVTLGIAYVLNGLADPFEQWHSTPHVFLYLAAAVVGVLAYMAAMAPAFGLQQSFRDKVIPAALGFVRNLRYRRATTPDSFDRLPREVLEAFTDQRFEDVISGVYEDFSFELYEAAFWKKNRGKTTDIFRGVVISFDTLSPFPGLLVAARRKGTVSTSLFSDIFGRKLKYVPSNIAELDEAYDFETDNVEAAAPLVTGRLAQALQWLAEMWPEQRTCVALRGNDGFLLIPTSRNLFELPDSKQPLDYRAHVAPMIADMAALLATASLVRKVGASGDAPAQAAAQP